MYRRNIIIYNDCNEQKDNTRDMYTFMIAAAIVEAWYACLKYDKDTKVLLIDINEAYTAFSTDKDSRKHYSINSCNGRHMGKKVNKELKRIERQIYQIVQKIERYYLECCLRSTYNLYIRVDHESIYINGNDKMRPFNCLFYSKQI